MDCNEYIEQSQQIRKRLYSTAFLYMGSEKAALDTVDETIYKGFNNFKKLRNVEFFVTWMTRILINTCNTELKRQKRQIPIFENLAKAVALSPSLKAAVENKYVQPINLTKIDNGIALKVEYVIVDERQINIFYSLSSNDNKNLRSFPEIVVDDNSELANHSTHTGDPDKDTGLHLFTVDFVKSDVPDSLKLKFDVWQTNIDENNLQAPVQADKKNEPSKPNYIANFNVDLNFNPTFTNTGKTIDLKQWIQLDNQKIFIKDVEVYPSHIRLNLEDDENNTAWLKSLQFSIIDKNGKLYGKIKNGILAFGSGDSPFISVHMLESNYFSKSESFTISITGATWLDKKHEFVTLDLKNKTYDYLPEGVSIDVIEKINNGWKLKFLVKSYLSETMHSVFEMSYKDSDGNDYEYNGISSFYDETNNQQFYLEFILDDYNKETVIFEPQYSFHTPYTQAKEISIIYK